MKTKVLVIALMLVTLAVKAKGQIYPYKYYTKDGMHIYEMEEPEALKDNNEIIGGKLTLACKGTILGFNLDIIGI